ncbi:hypothetical protein PIB30_089555 [Stylosanthes scabra]|uniref:Protein SPEAR3-like n=1 Tax=Stylosanthes scabra TaxID=79078 RepID=A0ABU6ZSN3_9FABA|nr:hypothetical protein [Stylosanthes scabra]
MGSSYFGEANLVGNIERGGSGGSSSSSSSSRKGKKKSNSEKQPRQPQRGLGVAQLEKIRLHTQMPSYAYHHHHSSSFPSSTFNNLNMQDDPRVVQMAAYSSPPSSSFSYSSSSTSYSPSYAFQTNIMMGLTEYEKTNMRYGDSRSTNTPRWENANAGMLENQCSSHHSNVTIPFLSLYVRNYNIILKKYECLEDIII